MRRELLRFGGWFQVNNLARVVNQQTDAILIATFVDVRSVGYYGIGSKIADLVRILPVTLLGPLLPAATGIHADGDERRIANTVRQGGRLIGLLTLGLAGFVVVTSPLIMEVWLGRSYPHVPAITSLLALAYAVSNLTGVGTTVAAAVGKPRYESEYAVVAMTLNIGATLGAGSLLRPLRRCRRDGYRGRGVFRLLPSAVPPAHEPPGVGVPRNLALATHGGHYAGSGTRPAYPSGASRQRDGGSRQGGPSAGRAWRPLPRTDARRVATLQVPGIARPRDGATRAPRPSAAAGLTAGRRLPLRGESMSVTFVLPGACIPYEPDDREGLGRWAVAATVSGC